jgi:hypothetical protein
MTQRKQARGECIFCGRAMTKGGMSRHLRTCPQRQAVINAAASKKQASKTERLYHLQIQDAPVCKTWIVICEQFGWNVVGISVNFR